MHEEVKDERASTPAESGRTFLLSGRCQRILKWTATISSVGQVVTLGIYWLAPPRPADQQLTLFAVVVIGMGLVDMLSGLFVWITMIWFTARYWPANILLKIGMVIVEVFCFGWIVPQLFFWFAYRPYIRSLGFPAKGKGWSGETSVTR